MFVSSMKEAPYTHGVLVPVRVVMCRQRNTVGLGYVTTRHFDRVSLRCFHVNEDFFFMDMFLINGGVCVFE